MVQDAVSVLYQVANKLGWSSPVFVDKSTASEEPHKPWFTFKVSLSKFSAIGGGATKKAAKKEAAQNYFIRAPKNLLRKIEKVLPDYEPPDSETSPVLTESKSVQNPSPSSPVTTDSTPRLSPLAVLYHLARDKSWPLPEFKAEDDGLSPALYRFKILFQGHFAHGVSLDRYRAKHNATKLYLETAPPDIMKEADRLIESYTPPRESDKLPDHLRKLLSSLVDPIDQIEEMESKLRRHKEVLLDRLSELTTTH